MSQTDFKNNEITVKGPDGDFYVVEKSGLNSALKNGYVIPPNEEIEKKIKLDEAGSGINPLIAGAESAASAATFGLSREAENALGITTPEDQALRQEANPIASGIGTAAGIVAPLIATGGASGAARAGLGAADLLNPIGAVAKLGTRITESALPGVAKVTAGLAETSPRIANIINRGTAGAVGGAAEGALFGVGQSIDEHALGDPEALGEHLISNVGVNALLGGAMSGLFQGIGGAIQGRNLGKNLDSLNVNTIDEAMPSTGAIVDPPSFVGVKPTSLDEIKKATDKAKASGVSLELPEAAVLDDALSRVEMEHPIHPLQRGSLNDQMSRDTYRASKELGEDGQALRNFEGLQKRELIQKTDDIINELSPSVAPTTDKIQAGDSLVKAFEATYEPEKKAAGQLVAAAKKLSGEGFDHLNGVVEAFTKDNPKIAQMFKMTDDGLSVVPYDTSMGFTKKTYSSIRDAVKALRKNPQDFEALFNIRKGLTNDIDAITNMETKSEVSSLRRVMMDYIQELVDKSQYPDLREGFRRYAINEKNRELLGLQKMLPEEIINKTFRNSESVSAAKQILSKDSFNEAVSNWIARAKSEATDNGKFSSNKFNTWLKNNEVELKIAFEENPQKLQKLKDITTIQRIIPDDASINPSGTAKTLVRLLSEAKTFGEMGSGVSSFIKSKTFDLAKEYAARADIERSLSGRSSNAINFNKLKEITQKAGKAIETTARQVFSDKGQAALIGLGISLDKKQQKETEKTMEKIQEITSDPEKLMNALDTNTKELYNFAPATTQAAQKAMIAQFKYLSSKIPKPINQKILSPKYVPSKSQIMKFNGYLNTVKQPASVMRGIKHGMVTSDQMETLKVVYPQLLSQMQMAVMEQLSDHLSNDKQIPYRTKLGLSQFLERPLDNSMTQESIAMNQMNTQGQMQNDEDGMIKPTSKGMASLSEDSRTQTGLQKLQQGEEA
jgi:hypothetical protein